MTWTAAAVIAMPCLAGAVCFALPVRTRAAVAGLGAVVTAGLAAAMGLQVADGGAFEVAIGAWPVPLGIRLRADGLSAFMVAMQTGVGVFISVYAFRYFSGRAEAGTFWPLWLFLWAALNGLYLTADLFNAYVALELMGVTAVGLVALVGGAALVPALRYLFVTFIGSLLYLTGVALVYAQVGAVDMGTVARVLAGEPAAVAALALMAAALLLKTAAFPLHFWLPPAHANAASPASAILSALVIKASFYLLVRLWQSVFVGEASAGVGEAVGVLGVLAVIWGSAQALRQARLKMLVAYSTVAQVGYLLMAFPLGGVAWRGAIYFAGAHACAKAAMFMAAGTIQRELGHDDVAELRGAAGLLPVTLFTFALAGVALIGLPPSGGFVGKWILLEQAVAAGAWLYVAAIPAGTLLSVAYVFRVINPAFAESSGVVARSPAVLLEAPALILALAALVLGFASAPLLDFLDIGDPLGGAP